MQDRERVAQTLDVESGWEIAVETVLGEYLQAVCVNDVSTAAASLTQLLGGNMTLLVDSSGAQEPEDENAATLAAKVTRAPAAIVEVLRTVRVAESLDKALAIRERLSQREEFGSVITVDGVWLSKNWLRVCRDKDAKAGVIGREHEMRRLKTDIRESQAESDNVRKLMIDGRRRLTQLEERRENLQGDTSSLLGRYSELKAELDAVHFQMGQANERQLAIAEESGDIEREHFAAENQIRESRAEFTRATDQLAEIEDQRTELEAQREDLRAELHRVRAQADEDRIQAHDLAIKFETRRSSKESAAQSLARMESQFAQFGNREQDIRQQLQQSVAPLESNKKELEKLLDIRVTIESERGEARQNVERIENTLRDLDQTRMVAGQSVEESQEIVNEARMAVQEIRIRREGFAEQLGQTGFELDELLEGLDEELDPDTWDDKLEKIRQRIDRLGPINLAAIDEFNEQTERKEYLDSQLADLNDALATLEGAIRKIDRETRTRFRETFANVDSGFKRLFPKLFGGGHAYLELTGDDLLSAGVTVMARPPGKRNSTIHLLSGGEKALTAVALVFAIFELNPAPFCLLDEVDAPLDDANIVRYCKIVKEMASKVQFVFITHNKVTMEMARHLTGVTMQEPGVSRLVAVDLDEAVKMAAS